jgi:hypothetical protein
MLGRTPIIRERKNTADITNAKELIDTIKIKSKKNASYGINTYICKTDTKSNSLKD